MPGATRLQFETQSFIQSFFRSAANAVWLGNATSAGATIAGSSPPRLRRVKQASVRRVSGCGKRDHAATSSVEASARRIIAFCSKIRIDRMQGWKQVFVSDMLLIGRDCSPRSTGKSAL